MPYLVIGLAAFAFAATRMSGRGPGDAVLMAILMAVFTLAMYLARRAFGAQGFLIVLVAGGTFALLISVFGLGPN